VQPFPDWDSEGQISVQQIYSIPNIVQSCFFFPASHSLSFNRIYFRKVPERKFHRKPHAFPTASAQDNHDHPTSFFSFINMGEKLE